MKPYVICHMNASVDVRILGSRWRPAENRMAGLFERLHEQLGGGSWLIGRVTDSEYAKAEAYPDHTDQTYPREPWFAQRSGPASRRSAPERRGTAHSLPIRASAAVRRRSNSPRWPRPSPPRPS
jgi:hypothetical protein